MFTTSIKNAVVQVSGSFRTGYPALSDKNASNTGEMLALSPPVSTSAPPMIISVLLVDDEPLLLDVGKLSLERMPGITVTTAGSATDALELFASGSFDIIVSDYQMPEMDGLGFLKEVRIRSQVQPFIIFTGKGREDVVIEALNSGADYYVQKGGEPKAQYAELLHKIRRAVRQRRADAELRKKHEILRALLLSSPNGIAFVRNRTLQWVNESMGMMLGYTRAEIKGMHLSQLYENEATYTRIGSRIQSDLKATGKSKVTTRFRHKAGFSIDTEIHIAPLDRGNLHYGHMITMTDISEKLAIARNHKKPALFPHLELSPVIELDRNGEIIYYNDAAIEAMIRYGSRGTLEEFFPQDMNEILTRLDETNVGSIYRNVVIGPAVFRVHITLSAQFQVIRLSALNISGQPEVPAQ
ncbi:response regulator [uncultured Methanoregula sp.]|uniref:response regulator n=1 Tax=uncultured Methanoregula sp. TaxID=1005933 RepID=UPI002AAB496B|nr:response regulator [uncultured Methanoregula sp.]